MPINPFPAYAPPSIVGQSPQIQQIRRMIERVGKSRAPVLILGETGTGKEVAARALHQAEPRGSFIPIDCGSLVGPLMESELFGHAKGAFTGASETKKGLIELANGGTAFFDEIGDLPLELQVKLLRLLQEREYRPVGSLAWHKVDIRVIAATHRNLVQQVERGLFRQDLFYRLNVIALRLPPLRERKEDIPDLIERFLAKSSSRYTITAEAMDLLKAYDWPGNVRELQNCLDRMMAVNSGPLLHTQDLASSLINFGLAQRTGKTLVAVATHNAAAISQPSSRGVVRLVEMERVAIVDALKQTRGDRGMAAYLLGIGRTTLYRKLKEYQIDAVSD